jgi:hypothetical protein
MNSKAITGSLLRQSMIEQMELRGLAPRTINTYVGWVSALYGIDLCACPRCRTGRMEPMQILPAIRCHDPPPS